MDADMETEMEVGECSGGPAATAAATACSKRLGIKNTIQTSFGDDYVFQIASSQEIPALAVSLSTNMIKLYSQATGQNFGGCKGHRGTINEMSFSAPASPHVICSFSSDGSIRAWDTRTLNQYVRNVRISYFWNRLPELDSQYVYLFTQLDKSVHFHQKCWSFYLEESSHSVHRVDYLKARDIARTLNLDELRDEDIRQCFVDVFAERDSIAEYKLKTGYDLFLLDCKYNQNLPLKKFTPNIILQSWIVRILILPFNNGKVFSIFLFIL